LRFCAGRVYGCLTESLRCWSRKPMAHCRAGSNPAAVGCPLLSHYLSFSGQLDGCCIIFAMAWKRRQHLIHRQGQVFYSERLTQLCPPHLHSVFLLRVRSWLLCKMLGSLAGSPSFWRYLVKTHIKTLDDPNSILEVVLLFALIDIAFQFSGYA
jgi:hypothetical protein